MDMKGLSKNDFLEIITNPDVDIEKEKKNIRMADEEETLDEDDNLSEEDEIESEDM